MGTKRSASVTLVLAAGLAVLFLLPRPADAGQEPAVTDSFGRLRDVLTVGTVVFVEDDAGERVKGKVRSLSADAMTIVTSGTFSQERSFPAQRIVGVTRVDSRLNGFLLGFAAGAVPGALLGSGVSTYCENEASSCAGAPLVVGGLMGLVGGWIGWAIDGAINGETPLFSRERPASATRLSLSPAVLPQGGLALTGSVAF
jgi:hypothetical protein